MPVFLRWLLVELIVRRILRHRRVRPYVDRYYPMATQQIGRFKRRVYPAMPGGYGYTQRRRRLGCCSGCFLMVVLAALGLAVVVALLHWSVSL